MEANSLSDGSTNRAAHQRRRFWTVSQAEARAHATILALVLWAIAAWALAPTGPLDVFGRLKFPDFVHFYTLGAAARAERFDTLYDGAALHARQVELVPASASLTFVPIYAPHTALVFRPFASLSYLPAAACWAGVTAAVYGLAVWVAWRAAAPRLDVRLIAAAAVSFPAFWNLVLHGQTTLVPLAAFTLAWLALRRGRSVLAGLALGLLTIKPQFGLVLAVVTVVCAEWGVIAGAIVSAGVQAALIAAVMGSAVLVQYAHSLMDVVSVAPLLEPKPFLLHSIRTITGLLPASIGGIGYVASVLAIGTAAVFAWRSRAPLDLRFAAVMLATALASPHLTIYDVTVLAPPLIWIGAWAHTEGSVRLRSAYTPLVYALYFFLLVPTAQFVPIQASVFVQAALLTLVVWETRDVRDGGTESPPTRSALDPTREIDA